MDIAPAALTRVRDLYTQGHYRQAHETAAALGPLREWGGTAARLIGGRLAIQLAAPKLGRRMHLAAYRATPAHPEAVYYHARYRMERFGPLSTWRFMRAHPDWSDAPPDLHADWVALAGFIAARVRDFDRAERLLNRAEAMTPDRPWPCIERASVYEFADRPEDALAAARRSLELHPWFRPGVQSVAHLLLRQGRDRQALDFLVEADSHLESGLVAAQLFALQTDLGHYADARRTLERYTDLSPLIEPEVAKWLAARRADSAYFLGDYAAAARHAREVRDKFYDRFAERLENRTPQPPSPRGEFESPSPGPREAPLTGPGSKGGGIGEGASAPSSLSEPARAVIKLDYPPPPAAVTVYELLARYWKHPLPDAGDDRPPADGLPDAAERHRAEAAGWAAREFTLSLDAAVALIGRGVPFVLTLVEAGFSQPRLCVGADPVRGSVSVIDGLDRRAVDAPAGSLIERFAPFGPRCLALVPAAEAHRLDGLPDLTDGAAREALYAVQKPLLAHDRGTADAALRVMRDRFADHPLAPFAALALARFDANPVPAGGLRRAAREVPPRSDVGAGEGQRAARAEPGARAAGAARSRGRGGGRRTDGGPDARAGAPAAAGPPAGGHAPAAPVGPQPADGRGRVLPARDPVVGGPALRRGDRVVPVRLRSGRAGGPVRRRVLPCARATAQVPEALRLLQQRAGRAAVPVPAATRALHHALLDRDEPQQAAAALDQAINKLTPASGGVSPPEATRHEAAQALGELLMFRAECHASAGRFAAAEADLTAAKPLVPAVAWHKGAARVARIKPDLATAGAHYLEAIKLEPLAMDSHRTLAALLADTDGRAAARTHLAQACQRYPHHYPLMKLRAEFLSGDPEADADRALLDMLAENPDDAWALRQRALVLADRKDDAAARAALDRAGAIEPGHAWYYSVAAQVHKRADRTADAFAALRTALRQNIDQEALIAELVQLSRGRREKREALEFVAAELHRQPHTGEGLVAYVGAAHHVFQAHGDPEDHTELLETLERVLDDRPDLWQAWSVAVQQLAGLGRLDEARSLARDAAERFPLLGKLWLDLAQVCHAAGDAEGRLDARARRSRCRPAGRWPRASWPRRSTTPTSARTRSPFSNGPSPATPRTRWPTASWPSGCGSWGGRGRRSTGRRPRSGSNRGTSGRGTPCRCGPSGWTPRTSRPT
ncbi:tetratricopeptide repeat protein [Frigoriglobus tundricola]|uniref:tetratricopeptide repeat protein n=1 Tax=Frigoriglobus tundricola TaxID=2774151 RepID=UPI00148EE733|nr:hypothetical protein [Frigoriglobus tundricola]